MDLETHAPQSSNVNVTIRKKSKSNKKQFKGKFKSISLFTEGEDNFTDIPISAAEVNWDGSRALKASNPDLGLP